MKKICMTVVPGVAFTTDGKRCGHGAGFHDTFLNRCGSKTNTVALALGIQVIDNVPIGAWDVEIDRVIFYKRNAADASLGW